ncbi:hypothetical protein [Shewanella algae]|uniref:hypothetical protein n=1 Tax=Shewanella algae TaxID=38313 RepID=UPI0031F4A9EC
MFGKILKATAVVGLTVLDVMLSDSDEDKRQLEQLDDGMGNIIADGEHMTRQEAEDAQSRGELYDTYL